MRSSLVEVRIGVLRQHACELPLVQNQDVIETLATNAAEKTFIHGVYLRCRLQSIRPMRQVVFESPIRSTHMPGASSTWSRDVVAIASEEISSRGGQHVGTDEARMKCERTASHRLMCFSVAGILTRSGSPLRPRNASSILVSANHTIRAPNPGPRGTRSQGTKLKCR